MQKVIGLAGHIDHGKTALVKALTGVDTDRLEEEKRRGVTIDIGIAFYNEEVTFIDVPGHERFIKNMVTGVSTVDMAMLVIAADDGVMPQTREHLDILKLLGVQKLVVALNKIDLVEADWVEMVSEEVRIFLEENGYRESMIIPVSAVKDLGISELKMAVDTMLATVTERENPGLFRMPIDRVFSVKGFGTVVTGTVLSHELRQGQQVQVYPAGQVFSVRGLQSHHRDVERVRLGDRAALNLAGASVDELGRGAFLGSPQLYQSGDSWLGVLEVLPHWERHVQEADRVHVHVGTGKQEARLHLLDRNRCKPGDRCPVQVFFDQQVAASFGERTVVRFESPEFTLGGIQLVWAQSRRMKKSDDRVVIVTSILEQGLREQVRTVLRFFRSPLSQRELSQRLSVTESKIAAYLKLENGIVQHEGKNVDADLSELVENQIIGVLENYHKENPLGEGLPTEALGNHPDTLRQFSLGHLQAGNRITAAGSRWQLSGHETSLSTEDERMHELIVGVFRKSNYASPTLDQLISEYGAQGKKVLDWMINHSELVRVDTGYYVLQEQLRAFIETLKAWFRDHEILSVPETKTLIPVTRKYILPLLNYAERKAFVLRQGDVRVWIGEELKNE